jgi:hypothetical protein
VRGLRCGDPAHVHALRPLCKRDVTRAGTSDVARTIRTPSGSENEDSMTAQLAILGFSFAIVFSIAVGAAMTLWDLHDLRKRTKRRKDFHVSSTARNPWGLSSAGGPGAEDRAPAQRRNRA